MVFRWTENVQTSGGKDFLNFLRNYLRRVQDTLTLFTVQVNSYNNTLQSYQLRLSVLGDLGYRTNIFLSYL